MTNDTTRRAGGALAPPRPTGPCRRAAKSALLLLYSLCAFAAAPASAMQVLDAVDHAELVAQVSATAVSRIALGNDRIARVIRAPGGFETEHDPGSGDLYLRPLGPGDAETNEREPVSLFIGTEKGFTYRLTLTVAERGSAQILIRNAAAARSMEDAPASDARIAELVRLVGSVARREPLARHAVEAAGAARVASGVTALETWRGPRFEALVLEVRDAGLADAAALAARLATGSGSGTGTGIAAVWMSGPGPDGARLAVAVREAQGMVR